MSHRATALIQRGGGGTSNATDGMILIKYGPHVCGMNSSRVVVCRSDLRGWWMSRNDWKDICSRRLGIVNWEYDLDMHFAGVNNE